MVFNKWIQQSGDFMVVGQNVVLRLRTEKAGLKKHLTRHGREAMSLSGAQKTACVG